MEGEERKRFDLLTFCALAALAEKSVSEPKEETLLGLSVHKLNQRMEKLPTVEHEVAVEQGPCKY